MTLSAEEQKIKAREYSKKWRAEHPEKTRQVFPCGVKGCTNTFTSDRDGIRKGKTGKCLMHAKRGPPYGPGYSRLKKTAAKIGVSCELSYEDFLLFTETKNCTYCSSIIPWSPHYGDAHPQSYFLDRKDNDKGYSVDNCVVCCTRCNFMRQARFTYEEFLLFRPILQEIERQRALTGIATNWTGAIVNERVKNTERH